MKNNQRKSKNYWSKEKCEIEALKYKSRSQFKSKAPGAYIWSQRNGQLDNFCAHMKPVGNLFKRTVYIYEFSDKNIYVGITYNIEERDSKHKRDKRSKVYQHITKTGLMPKLSHISYVSVDEAILMEHDTVEKYKKNGYIILNVAKTGAVGGGNLKWNFDKVKKEALKYSSRKEFATKNNSAYNSARRFKWLEDVCSHMITKKEKKVKGYWTKERCVEEAKKYKTKKELLSNSLGAYMSMFKNNWLNEICSHMRVKKPNGYWTKERCIEEAKKYKTKKEFVKNNNSAYSIVVNNGWLEDIKKCF